MEKKEIYKSVIGVFAIIIVVAGATYAWYAWRSTNTNIQGTVGCFDIDYDKGQDIGSAQNPYALTSTCDYTEGAKATVTINTKANCYESANATIYLNSTSFNLYGGESAFTAPTQRVLKYQVTKGTEANETVVSGCSGYVESLSSLPICTVGVGPVATAYNVYLYLDCDRVTTTYIGSTYTGYIQTVATQNLQ